MPPPSAQASLYNGSNGNNKMARQGAQVVPDSRGSIETQKLGATSPPRTAGTAEAQAKPEVTVRAAAATLGEPSRDRVTSKTSVAGSEPPEDMATLLEQLSQQKAELRANLEQAERRRVGVRRHAEAQARGRFVGGQVWKRPCAYADEFSQPGMLPIKNLTPFEFQAASRPSRSYERKKDPVKGPFWDVETEPRLFGEPPALPPHVQPCLLAGAQAVLRSTPRGQEPLDPTPREPRHARFTGTRATQAKRAWVQNNTTPREIAPCGTLEERIFKNKEILAEATGLPD